MTATAPYRKKLIEVALPLKAINIESAKDKSQVHGHPSTLHRWWARRPLAACRAVIFASLVDDPGEAGISPELLRQIDTLADPNPIPEDWDDLSTAEKRRERLFTFISQLIKWQSTTNQNLINTARELILASTDGDPPPIFDPFSGGGSIPLEAQRLGLQAYAADLNPVAVLITKALVELPPKFADLPPVNPDDREGGTGGEADWRGAAGLAADVRYYGNWMREQALERIGHLYPKGPNGETVIAWLWARTVACPNPACQISTPLVRSFQLTKKKGRHTWASPAVDHANALVTYNVTTTAPEWDDTIGRRGAECIACGSAITFPHIRAVAQNAGLGHDLIGVVDEGVQQRQYRNPTSEDRTAPSIPAPTDPPSAKLPYNPRNFQTPLYGMPEYADLFTNRQLQAVITFSGLVSEARDLILSHAASAGELRGGGGGGGGGQSTLTRSPPISRSPLTAVLNSGTRSQCGKTPRTKSAVFSRFRVCPWFGISRKRIHFQIQPAIGRARSAGSLDAC